MPPFCAVHGCSNHSDRESQLSYMYMYYELLLKNKAGLKQWIRNIRRVSLTLKHHARVHSEHFANA